MIRLLDGIISQAIGFDANVTVKLFRAWMMNRCSE